MVMYNLLGALRLSEWVQTTCSAVSLYARIIYALLVFVGVSVLLLVLIKLHASCMRCCKPGQKPEAWASQDGVGSSNWLRKALLLWLTVAFMPQLQLIGQVFSCREFRGR